MDYEIFLPVLYLLHAGAELGRGKGWPWLPLPPLEILKLPLELCNNSHILYKVLWFFYIWPPKKILF